VRRMDERLEAALEDCRQRLARGESIEQCLTAYPNHREQLRELLPLFAPLKALAPAPDPAAAHAARRRFHGYVLAEQRRWAAEHQTPAPLRWLRRVAIPLAAVIALGGSGAGLVTASADALPGSPLFPIQQAKEQVVQRLARTPEQQVAYQVELAMRRLQQVQRAEATGKPPSVIDALTASMLQATGQAVADLHSVPEPQRQRIFVRVAPLLAAEDRALSAEGNQQAGATSATLEKHRQQLRAAEQRLRAAETAAPAVPRKTPTKQPSATAQPVGGTRQPAAVASVGPEPGQHAAKTALPTAAPPSTAKRRLANALATRTAGLRRIYGNSDQVTPQPVHAATP
jgi:hypothetical protein